MTGKKKRKEKNFQEPSGQYQKSNIHYLEVPGEKEKKTKAERKCIWIHNDWRFSKFNETHKFTNSRSSMNPKLHKLEEKKYSTQHNPTAEK